MKYLSSFILFVLLFLVNLGLPAQASFRLQSGGTTQMHLRAGSFLVLDSTNTYLENVVSGDGAVKLTGSRDVDFTTGDRVIAFLEIAKAAETFVVLTGNSTVSELVTFSGQRNFVEIGPHLFILGARTQVQGFGPEAYFVTRGSGGLLKGSLDQSQSPFVFPVGFDAQDYNPVTLTSIETATDFFVRCLPHALKDGSTGTPFLREVADVSWEIEPINNINPSFDISEVGWTGTDELPGFNRTRCGLAFYDNNSGWDLLVTDLGPAFGTNPYGRERPGMIKGGFFAVGNKPLASITDAEVDVLFGGNYAGGGLMTDALRENNLLPTAEPYTGLGFQHVAFGGGEAVNPAVFNVAGPDAIVDWLFVEVRDGDDPGTVVATQAALLQRDGDIVDLDGVEPLRLAGIPTGEYHLAIHHRNHLVIRTATPLAFGPDGVEYSFLVDPDQAFGGENAVKDLGDGFYGLVPGDVDHNGQVQNTDAENLSGSFGASGYQAGDTDLNGQVQNIDLQLRLTPNLGRGRQF